MSRAATGQVLVVDVGTSSVRAAVVARRRHRSRASHDQELLPDSPADGLVQFDATVDGDARALDSRAPRSTPRDRSTRSASPTSAARRSSGIATTGEPVGPGIGWQDLRTIGDCLALRARRRATSAQPVGHQGAVAARPASTPARGRDLCFGTVDTWVAWTLSDGRVHVTDATNAAVTGMQDARPRRLGHARRSTILGVPRSHDAGDRRLDGRSSAMRPRCPARRRSPRSLGDQQASLVGQGCVRHGDAKITFGTGGMLDLVLDEARRRARRTRASTARSRSSRGANTAAPRGASKRSCSRRAPTCSGSATTSG